MLRSDTRIVQSGRNGIYRSDLTIFVLTEIGFHTMEDAHSADIYRGCRFKSINAPSSCLASDQLHILVLNKMVEATDGIGAPTYAGNHDIRKSVLLLQHLLLYFLGDNCLEVTHNSRKRENRYFAVVTFNPFRYAFCSGVMR